MFRRTEEIGTRAEIPSSHHHRDEERIKKANIAMGSSGPWNPVYVYIKNVDDRHP